MNNDMYHSNIAMPCVATRDENRELSFQLSEIERLVSELAKATEVLSERLSPITAEAPRLEASPDAPKLTMTTSYSRRLETVVGGLMHNLGQITSLINGVQI